MPTRSCVLPVDLGDDAAGARPHHAHDAFHQRALAVAVGAEQHHGLAAGDGQRHVLQHAHRAVGGVDALDGEAIGQDRPSPLRGRGSRRPACRRRSSCRRPAPTSRCEKLITARMMCSIMMMVTPRSLRRISSATMSSTSECDRPAIDSSAISSFGSAAMARASSSLRISTCVRSRGIFRALASSADQRRARLVAARVELARAKMPPGRARYGIEQRHAQILGDRKADETAAAAGSCAPARRACAGAPACRR